MNILIVYERKNRELENSVLIKMALEKKGHRCKICQYYQGNEFNIFNNTSYDIIVVAHLYNTAEVIRVIARFGTPANIVNLQYEQVLSEKWEKHGHHNPSGEAINYQHVCWGEKTSKRLFDAGVPDANLHTIGALQLDLLREEYRQEINSREFLSKKYNLDSAEKWSLFLSSFTYADIESSRLKMNEAVAGVSLASFVKIHSKSRNELLVWFSKVLEKDKDNVFIYRPHPDELNLDRVYQLEKSYPNFVVIKSGSSKTWIEASDQIISWYSTTVVESHFLNKPYSILRPYPLSDEFDSVLLKKGTFICTQEKFVESFFSNIENCNFALKSSDVAEYYFQDETPTFCKLIDLLEKQSIKGSGIQYSFKTLLKPRLISVAVALLFYLIHSTRDNIMITKILKRNIFYRNWYEEITFQMAGNEELQSLQRAILTRLNHE
jgi:surface carbohydrate biosynthesis protein